MSFEPREPGYRIGHIYLLEDGRKVMLRHDFVDYVDRKTINRYLVVEMIKNPLLNPDWLVAAGDSFIVEKLIRQ